MRVKYCVEFIYIYIYIYMCVCVCVYRRCVFKLGNDITVLDYL